VDILLAVGQRPVRYVMPVLTGLSQAAAERTLAAAELRPVRVTYVAQSGSPAGTVIGQTPPPGSPFSGEGPFEISVAQ
jgi:beta-lactam-binding protein with PASTA domain